jgi:hypothetical protein
MKQWKLTWWDWLELVAVAVLVAWWYGAPPGLEPGPLTHDTARDIRAAMRNRR